MRAFVVATVALVTPLPSSAEDMAPAGPVLVTAVRAAAPIRIDGRLDDPGWESAPTATGFRQLVPIEGAPVSEPTELRILYDDEALYVGARLYDSEPERIVKRLSRRDLIPESDTFSIYLDPQHDHLTGVQFQVSAAGVQRDAIVYNDTFTDDAWNAVWESAVTTDGMGWTVELRVPFSQLRFGPGTRQVWGINAERTIYRKNEAAWLELVPSREHGLASRMGHLEGLERPPTVRHLELLPYVSARNEIVQPADPRDPFNDGSRYFGAVGGDLRYRLTSSLALDATVNPDFGQVEVDPAVVNLTGSETFFEEKRPFFVEGSRIFTNFGREGVATQYGFFRTEPDLFYSRRIGRAPRGTPGAEFADLPATTTILGAAKLTGRTAGGWTIGLLEAVTGRETARIMDGRVGGREAVEPLTNYLVARVRREAGTRAAAGFLVTSTLRSQDDEKLRDLLVDRSLVAGFDGHYFFDRRREWVVSGALTGSWLTGTPSAIRDVKRAPVRYLQRPDAPHIDFDPNGRSLSGWTGHVDFHRNAGSVLVNAAVWGMSPGFDANDLGFMNQADRAGGHGLVLWRKTTPDRFTRSRHVWISKWWTWNWAPESQGDGVQALVFAEFHNYWRLQVQANFARRVWDDRLTRGGPTTIRPGNRSVTATLTTDPRGAASATASINVVRREFGSWSQTASLTAALKPASWIGLSVGPTFFRQHNAAQYVTSVVDPLASETYGGRYVFANLEQDEISMTARANIALSPTLSFQTFFQPLVSAGDYRSYKELTRPRSYDFTRYGIDAGTIEAAGDAGRRLIVDPDGDGPAAPFTFTDADFNVRSMRLNSILRWEWRPGSALFLVWTQQRRGLSGIGDLSIGRDLSDLFTAPADDVVALKLTYWFGR